MTKKAPEKKAVKATPAKKTATPKKVNKGVDLTKMVSTIAEDLKTNPVKTSKPPTKPKAKTIKKVTVPSLGVSTATLIAAMTDKPTGLPVNTSIGGDLGPKTLMHIPTRQDLKKTMTVKTESDDGKILAKDIFNKPAPERKSGFSFVYR